MLTPSQSLSDKLNIKERNRSYSENVTNNVPSPNASMGETSIATASHPNLMDDYEDIPPRRANYPFYLVKQIVEAVTGVETSGRAV